MSREEREGNEGRTEMRLIFVRLAARQDFIPPIVSLFVGFKSKNSAWNANLTRRDSPGNLRRPINASLKRKFFQRLFHFSSTLMNGCFTAVSE